MAKCARLSVRIQGDGPAIVFIMGRNAAGKVWDAHQVPSFMANGWATVTFDNRGVGTNYTPGENIIFDDFVSDVVDIITEYVCEPVFLVGTSLGSRIALTTAARYPQLVRGVVAAAAHARLNPIQSSQAQETATAISALANIAPGYLAAHTAMMNLSPSTLSDDATCHDWLSLLSFGIDTSTEGLAQQIDADCGADQSAEYRQITAPVLALAYGDDRVIYPQQVQEVAQLIPQATYAELPHAGHFGYLERPKEFNDMVHSFFQALL